MKNKLLVAVITVVYMVLCLNVGVFAADANAPTYTVAGVYGNSFSSGGTSLMTVTLRPLGTSAARVSATLTSANANVSVDSYTEQESYEAMPVFRFIVSAPLSADGTYSLSLNVNMFDETGAYIGSDVLSIPVTVKNGVNVEGLEFTSFSTDPDIIVPGDEFSLAFIMKNTCGTDLENVKVSLPGLDNSKFVIDGGFTYKTVNVANGANVAVVFDMIAMDGISSVREAVSVMAEYSIGGKSYSAETDVVLSCEPASEEEYTLGAMDLTVTDYRSSSDRIRPDRVFTLTLYLENSGNADIEKARVNVLNLDGTKFAVNEGLTYQDFSIAAGETKKISFELIGCDGISSTREVLPVQISYGGYSDTIYCTLSCKPAEQTQTDAEQVFAPNIIITDYDFGGEFVTAGSKFPLTITFENTSSDATIENLKITINGASSSIDGSIAFSASNSANSFFFEKLDTKGSDSVTLEMLAKSDATPNSYPIDISFSYEYTANGKRYQASTVRETINIPLQQEDRLVVNEPYYPSWVVYVGESCYVSTSLINMGKSGVYNVTASIEGEGFSMTEYSYYIGNIESGREEYYDTEIYPEIAGQINCELVITYEDANGNSKEKRIPFTVNAQDMYFEDVYYEEPIIDEPIYEEPASSSNWLNLPQWAWYAIGGSALAILIIIIIAVSVKKKKARLEVDEDDEDI